MDFGRDMAQISLILKLLPPKLAILSIFSKILFVKIYKLPHPAPSSVKHLPLSSSFDSDSTRQPTFTSKTAIMSVRISATSFTITNSGSVAAVVNRPGGLTAALAIGGSLTYAVPGTYTISINNAIGSTITFGSGDISIAQGSATAAGAEFTVATTVA